MVIIKKAEKQFSWMTTVQFAAIITTAIFRRLYEPVTARGLFYPSFFGKDRFVFFNGLVLTNVDDLLLLLLVIPYPKLFFEN